MSEISQRSFPQNKPQAADPFSALSGRPAEPPTIQELIAQLKAQGAVTLHFHFYGSGDEGAIQEIWALDQNGDHLPIVEETLLDDWAYDYIEKHIKIDWVNNEGGGGDLVVDVLTGKTTLDSYVYVSDTESQEPIEGEI